MTDNQQQVDQWAEQHLHRPKDTRPSARDMYAMLRDKNPWLPDEMRVSAGRDLEITFGAESMATLNLTVYIELPDVLK